MEKNIFITKRDPGIYFIKVTRRDGHNQYVMLERLTTPKDSDTYFFWIAFAIILSTLIISIVIMTF